MKKKMLAVLAAGLMMSGIAGTAMATPVVIDGTIAAGEWAGATSYTIGNGGGTAFFKADQNYVYAAFDITGWTAAMGPASGGNLLGFGVWKADNSYGPSGTGVEFQQATDKATWGGDGPSGTMNGLQSAFRLNTVLQTSIPGTLQAMDSFATGHHVWEVEIPISTMAVSAGDTIYMVGGINFDKAQHWYPETFYPGYNGYAPITVEAAPVPEPGTMMLLGAGFLGLAAYGKRRKSA